MLYVGGKGAAGIHLFIINMYYQRIVIPEISIVIRSPSRYVARFCRIVEMAFLLYSSRVMSHAEVQNYTNHFSGTVPASKDDQMSTLVIDCPIEVLF